LEEITFLENNRAALDKIKMEKEAAEAKSNVPDSFGKPQENADQFQTIMVVKKKKRTLEEITKPEIIEAIEPEVAEKQRKLNPTTE
jgi:hypothetical protein